MHELHPPCVHQVSRTNPSTRPGLDLCWPPATPSGSILHMCTPPESYSCQILSDVVGLCQILFPSKPVVCAIEISHAACKDDFSRKSSISQLSFINFSIIYIQGSPSGCVRSEFPGVTQVDENGHKGNTSVVTAYICWRKHGIYLSWGINSD